MNTLKITFVIFITSLCFLSSCSNKTETIIQPDDYNSFLENKENKSLENAKKEIDFWQKKFDAAPNQYSYLSKISGNYTKLFEITGNIDYLIKSEQLLLNSNESLRYTNVGTIRSLARNYISQHRFKDALVLANKALAIGEGMKETQKLLFDVQMELGNFGAAENALKQFANNKDFDYLIRISKWSDHKGYLDKAISFMEKATKVAEFNNNEYLKIWCYSNLGDMSGHAGKITDSYNYYLKTLQHDNNNTYALKGIAWIAFSHEKNTTEANRIIDIISKKHNSPDFYLLKSEIAAYEKNIKEKDQNLAFYFAKLQNENYGVMYNKYNALLYSQNKSTANKALIIALEEVSNRPTPDSYDLLAWAYYNLGDVKKALEISQKYVAGKSFEPKLNYHLATIYKANNLLDKVKPIKEELKNSSFELGPNLNNEIQKL